MKIVAIITYIFLAEIAFSQNSYYFSNPLPTEEKKVQTVDEKWFGQYKDESTSLIYDFSAEGVTVISTQVSSVSKKLVRESTQYSVKNNFIFGIVENDSLPCVLEDGFYYFGIRNRDAVIFKNSTTQLTRINDREYLLNYNENGKFSPVKLTFSAKGMTISEFDYDPEKREFEFIEKQSESTQQQQTVIVLSPSPVEFNQLNSAAYFIERSAFLRITE